MRLKELREQRGLSQKQVSEVLGCSSVTYLRYENGTHDPSIETLINLADFFGVSIDYMVGRPEMNGADPNDAAILSLFHSADERAKNDATSLLKAHGKK